MLLSKWLINPKPCNAPFENLHLLGMQYVVVVVVVVVVIVVVIGSR